jgi:multidrug efflux pump
VIVSNTAVRQRISVVVLAIIIVVFGIYNYIVIPRESDPDITIPNVFISTNYKGVSASDIESSITIPIEKKLKGLEGVKKLSSISSEGSSSINLEFVTGTDIDEVLQKVRNKVDEAKGDLPGDLEEDPSVFEVNISEMPIVVFSISGTCGNPCLKKIADDLADDFEAIAGVLEAPVTGGLEREIRVEVDPDKLAYYAIPITAFQQALANENTNTSGGSLRLGDGRYQLRVPGEFKSPEELFALTVGMHEGDPVYLKDVATVVDGFKEERSRARLDGREAVSISVKKRAGENIIRITDEVDLIIEDRQRSWPKGTTITKLMDKAKEIQLMVSDLENNILSGLVLVVFVILFSMGLRNAILVSMAIPFSMLLSFSILNTMGITLNMVVLFSLTLALGMLVDNAIVIVENIYRHMQQGVPRLEAAMSGTGEVAWPVIFSTVTTLGAFSPMLLWPGIMGEFMGYLPLTLIITLSSSLFVAMVINPALCALLMKVKDEHVSKVPLTPEQIKKAGETPIVIKGVLLTLYVKVLRRALHHRIAVLLSAFCILVILIQVWLLVVGIEKPVEFFPDIAPKSLYINLDVPEGADIGYTDGIIKEIEMLVNGMPQERITSPSADRDALYAESLAMKSHEMVDGTPYSSVSDMENIEHVYTKAIIGSGGMGSMFESNAPNNVAVQFIDFDKRTISSKESLEMIRERIKMVAGGKITVEALQEGPPTGAPINIEISGDDHRVLGAISKQIRQVLEQTPHVEDVRDDFEEGLPSVRVTIDKQKAALVGLSTGAIGFALKTGYNGLDVSTYRESGEDYDITVQLSENDRKVVDVLRELLIPSPTGKLVPLTTIATIDYSGSIGSIMRINNERVITVKANVDELKIPAPVARAEAAKLLEQLHLPSGYKIKFTGEFEFQKESEDFLSKAFIIALFLIFFILVTQFNAIGQPFIIMTSVILSLGGVFLGLTVMKFPFGIIMTGVGVISLAGVVVNNGIVLIDYINKLVARGMSVEEAVISGGATRLRPVILTAITTVLGLLPMVTGISYDFHKMAISWSSEVGQWWVSMAIAVVYGLIVATFLTLVVVPVLYASFAAWHDRFEHLYNWLRDLYWRPYENITGNKAPHKQ